MPTSNKQTQSKDERSSQNVAHSPGHQKMNLKSHPQNSSAMNNMAGDDIIHRNESPQRRIISGASLGKKGQRDRQ